MSSVLPRALVFGLALLLVSCAPTLHPHTSIWRFEDVAPIANREVRPGYEFAQKRSFTVQRLSGTEQGTSLSEIAERQALVALVYQIERFGYVYVDGSEKADLIAAIDYARNDYRTSYVPPSSVTVPVWVPGQTYTSYTTASAFGTGGYARGYATTTTTSPGYMTTQTHTSGGYMSGAYYPTFRVSVFDAKTAELVYAGGYTAVTQIQDIRVAFPFAAEWILLDLPAIGDACQSPRNYIIGYNAFLATLDGNRYFPVVHWVDPEITLISGQLMQWDVITAINGRSVEGASYCETVAAGDPGRPGQVTFSISRGGETLQVIVAKRPL